MSMQSATVEYYLIADDGYLRVQWEGPDPSFVLLAPLHEALDELGAFTSDAEAAWPSPEGEPYFMVSAQDVGEFHSVFASTNWSDYITATRVRDVLGVPAASAANLLELSVREAERLTELFRTAEENGCGLLCVVF